MKALLEQGRQRQSGDAGQDHAADGGGVQRAHRTSCKLLIDAGADVERKDQVDQDRHDLRGGGRARSTAMKLLLDRGVDVNHALQARPHRADVGGRLRQDATRSKLLLAARCGPERSRTIAARPPRTSRAEQGYQEVVGAAWNVA